MNLENTMTDQEKIIFIRSALRDLNINAKADEFTASTALTDLDIDSLDAVELQMYYEEKTGVETADPTGPLVTVKDLMDLMP
jgi:acyl carrier protein